MSDVEKLVTLVHGHQEALAVYNLLQLAQTH